MWCVKVNSSVDAAFKIILRFPHHTNEFILYFSNSVAIITDISPLHENCLIKFVLYILYN